MIIINGIVNTDNKITLDEGFFFGRAVFETILIKEKPVFLKEHLQRMNSAAITLSIKNEVTEEYVLNLIDEFGIKNCALKIILSPENIILTTRQITYEKKHYEEGFSLTVSKVIKNESSLLPYLKWTGYVENLIIKEKAMEAGFNDAILLNSKGFITETSLANIFFITNNILHTPSIDCGLLDGIVRKWMIKNYKVIEGHYTLDDILKSNGIFLCNSLMGIMKVTKIDTYYVSDNIIISTIMKDYDKFLSLQI